MLLNRAEFLLAGRLGLAMCFAGAATLTASAAATILKWRFDETAARVSDHDEGVIRNLGQAGSSGDGRVFHGEPGFVDETPPARNLPGLEGGVSFALERAGDNEEGFASMRTAGSQADMGLSYQATVNAGGMTLEAWIKQKHESIDSARVLSIGDTAVIQSRAHSLAFLVRSACSPDSHPIGRRSRHRAKARSQYDSTPQSIGRRRNGEKHHDHMEPPLPGV